MDLGIPTRYVGLLSDDTVVRQACAAADVTGVPSTEEAFGKTAAESMSCGTLVVPFDATGLVDVVGHKTSGYRATPFEASDLARGINWVFEDEDRWSALSEAGRTAVKQRFSVVSVANEYAALYDEILSGRPAPLSLYD